MLECAFQTAIKCGKVLGIRFAIESIRANAVLPEIGMPTWAIKVLSELEKEQAELDKEISNGG